MTPPTTQKSSQRLRQQGRARHRPDGLSIPYQAIRQVRLDCPVALCGPPPHPHWWPQLLPGKRGCALHEQAASASPLGHSASQSTAALQHTPRAPVVPVATKPAPAIHLCASRQRLLGSFHCSTSPSQWTDPPGALGLRGSNTAPQFHPGSRCPRQALEAWRPPTALRPRGRAAPHQLDACG